MYTLNYLHSEKPAFMAVPQWTVTRSPVEDFRTNNMIETCFTVTIHTGRVINPCRRVKCQQINKPEQISLQQMILPIAIILNVRKINGRWYPK